MGIPRGVGVTLALFSSSSFGTIFWQAPFLWLAFVSEKWFRWWMDMTMNSWITMATAILEYGGGVRVRHFGDLVRPGERAVLLLNHRTRLDWLYIWSVLVRCRCARQLKIVLKTGLNFVPGAGWAMQCAAFIFLHRRWDTDKRMLTDFLNYFIQLDHPCQILLFPEGTDLTPNTKARSDKFAEAQGLPEYKHTLHPRTTGFVHIVQTLRAGSLDAIYDMTIAYPYNVAQREPDLLMGRLPAEVHYHVTRYTDIPKEEAQLEVWLAKIWKEKEAALTRYYAAPSEERKFPDESELCSSSAILIPAVAVWVVFFLVCWFCASYWLFWVVVVGFSAMYVGMGRLYGGIDKWAVARTLSQVEKER